MKYLKIFVMTLAALFFINSAAYAEESTVHIEDINLTFHSSKYVNLGKKISMIWCGSKIVFFHQPTDSMNEFIITAQSTVGSTTLFVWTADGERYEFQVNVTNEEVGQAAFIEEAINLPTVKVKKLNNKILLTGTVENTYEHDRAIEIARLYTTGSNNNSNDIENSNIADTIKEFELGNIIDLLEVLHPTRIRLEAQVIEINSDKAKDLGITYGTGGSGGIFYFGEDYNLSRTTNPTSFRHNPAEWLEERFSPINATIHALVSNGDARILSRPNITTMSGETAHIQIGGQIPYTVSNSNGSSTNFKDYGIILQFKPTVDAQDRIKSVIHTEVSNLSGQSVDGQPIIATRTANTTIKLESGSTMIIGGLMDSSESKAVSKIPLLGNIPILGEFFKYTSKRRDKRELIILVTPYILGEGENSFANMSNDMKNYYHAGQREQNNLNDVNLNEDPPPLPDKKSKKDKSKDKKVADKKVKEKKVSDKKSQEKKSDEKKSKDKKEKNSNTSWGVEIFGDGF